jgi:1-acyl-sn-glycerol-3-phosphate acyltransferase
MTLYEKVFGKTKDINPAHYFDPQLVEKVSKTALPWFEKYFRVEYEGLENLPTRPFLSVGMHSGGLMLWDSLLWGGKYHSMGRQPRLISLAHNLLGSLNNIESFRLFRRLGIHAADARIAKTAFQEGFAVHVYPGGDRDVFRNFVDRHKVTFWGRKGYVRLAIESGVPLVPIATAGGHETFVVLWDGQAIAKRLGLPELMQWHIFPLTWGLGAGLRFGVPAFYIPLPAQISFSVVEPIYLDGLSPSDAKNPAIVSEVDRAFRSKMQQEINRLTRFRIPVVGRIYKPKDE